MTDAEIESIRKGNRSDLFASIGCLSFAYLGGSLGLAVGARLLGNLASPVVGKIAFYSVLSAGLAGTVYMGFGLLRSYRRRAKANRSESLFVEDLEVTTSRVRYVTIGNIWPTLCFDIGEGQVLMLSGQWLEDIENERYINTPTKPDDMHPDEWCDLTANLAEPFGFPCQAFTVQRLPHNGDVLSITIEGDYLQPEEADPSDGPIWGYEVMDSEIFPGNLDRLPTAIAEQRKRRGW